MGNISLSINGRRVTAAAGSSLLAIADANNIKIPRLCYHPQLKPYGACRLCLVEEEASGRLMAACVTPAAADMAIQTDSPRVLNHRRNMVRLMMAEHPESCVVCSKGNRCELRMIAARLGIAEITLDPMPNFKPLEQSNPFMTRDLSKCVLCGKCIRADHELVGVGAIDYSGRGFASRPATLLEKPLEHSSCTFCGTCAAMCPTGALALRHGAWVGTPEYEKPSVCGFCAMGCRLLLGVAGGQVVEVDPANAPQSVNGATLCIRGHYAHDFLHNPKRLTQPLIKGANGLAAAEWEPALDAAATALSEVRKKYGAQSIGFVGSSKCSNEENYLLQKLARVGLGAHNVDYGCTPDGRPGIEALTRRIGDAWGLAPLTELRQARAIVVLGADPGQTLPVLAYHLRQAAASGIPLVVAHRRPTDLDLMARFSLRLNPTASGPDVYTWLLTALARHLMALQAPDQAVTAPGGTLADRTFIDNYTEGYTKYAQALQALSADTVASATGVPPARIKEVAVSLSAGKIAFVLGQDVLNGGREDRIMAAVVNLSLLSGSLGQPGGGIYVEQNANNARGARLSGCLPHLLPGGAALTDPQTRRYWEKTWHTALSPDQGLSLTRMLEQAEAGNLKALYIMGANPLRNLPDRARVQAALGKLEVLVVQDILHTETIAMATIVLPGAPFSEKSGHFINLEGRIQPFYPVVAPPGHAQPDWWILAGLNRRLVPGATCKTLEDVQHEMRVALAGYDGGNSRTASWLQAPTNPYTLFRRDGGGGPLAFTLPPTPVPAPEALSTATAESLHAFIAAPRHHLGGGTRTAASSRIQHWENGSNPTWHGDCVVLHPHDAERLQLAGGDQVSVVSDLAAINRQVRLDARLSPGSVLLYAGSQGNDVVELLAWPAEQGRMEDLRITIVKR